MRNIVILFAFVTSMLFSASAFGQSVGVVSPPDTKVSTNSQRISELEEDLRDLGDLDERIRGLIEQANACDDSDKLTELAEKFKVADVELGTRIDKLKIYVHGVDMELQKRIVKTDEILTLLKSEVEDANRLLGERLTAVELLATSNSDRIKKLELKEHNWTTYLGVGFGAGISLHQKFDTLDPLTPTGVGHLSVSTENERQGYSLFAQGTLGDGYGGGLYTAFYKKTGERIANGGHFGGGVEFLNIAGDTHDIGIVYGRAGSYHELELGKKGVLNVTFMPNLQLGKYGNFVAAKTGLWLAGGMGITFTARGKVLD